MRLTYVDPPSTPASSPPAPATLASATAHIAARRANGKLLDLDRALLHSPPFAQGWSSMLGALRDASEIAADARELAICRVAALNGSRYEWDQHAPLLERALAAEIKADEVQKVMESVQEMPVGAFARGTDPGMAEKYRVVLALADEMTARVDVSEECWEDVRREFGSEREITEVVGVVATYNCVSRFLVAMDVGEVGLWAPGARLETAQR